MTRKFSSKFGVVSLSLLFAATLFGQRSDKATVITFTSPVEIPGSNPQVLPAGTYMFKLVDSKSTPHIVQVSNKEESKVYSTIIAIPAQRDASTRDTVVTFEERGGGRPQAVQTWFYPNDINGEQFVYSRLAAIPVAVAAAPPAPARSETPAPVPPVERATPPVAQTAPAPPPAPQQVAAAPPPPAPQPAPQTQAAPTPTPTAAPDVQVQQPPQELPRTASSLPLVLLAGVLCLSAGLVLRRFSQG